MLLSKEELLNINGGVSAAAVFGITAGAILLIGAVDGFVRPTKCH